MGTLRTAVVCAVMGTCVHLAAGGAAGGAAPATPAKMPAGIRVVPVSVSETRSRTLGSAKPRFPSRPEAKLTIHVVGPAAAKATRFGKVVMDKVTDDKGNDLVDKTSMFGRKQREGVKTISKWKRTRDKSGFGVEIRFRPAPRDATKLAEATGSMKVLSGGKKVDVVVADANAKAGQYVDNAALKAAGLKVKIVKGGGGFMAKATKSIFYVLEGNADVLLDVKMVDATGKKVDSSSGWFRSGKGPKIRHVEADREMPRKAALKLTVLSGAKALTVPIRLKDIPLP